MCEVCRHLLRFFDTGRVTSSDIATTMRLITIKASVLSPCHLSDPELNNCMKKGAQYAFTHLWNGLPEIGLKPFDPLKIIDVKGNIGNVLNMELKNIVISGIKETKVLVWKVNHKKKNIKFSTVNSTSMKAKYKANGRLLIIPVTGDGDCYIKMKDIVLNYTIPFDVVKGQDAKDHWKLKTPKVSYAPQGVEFDFTNLFNGNKLLADEVIRFANENWREIFYEVSTPLMSELIKTVIAQMQTVFDVLPLEDFLLP